MANYVVANWKSHKTIQEAEQWLTKFLDLYQPDLQVRVIIAPSFVTLAPLRQLLQKMGKTHLCLASQDISPFPLGAYSGAVAGEMLRGLVDYAIVGHSERRRYFHETNQEVANKVSEAAAVKLKPVLCVDQPYARAQIAALDEADIDDLIIGYGPVEAIGIDLPQSPDMAAKAIREIRDMAPDKPILYGGSVNAANAGDYMSITGVSGVMVGAASLAPEEFAGICETVSRY